MIESVSGIGATTLTAGVRSPTSTAAPTEGPSFDQALAQVVGSAVNTLQTGEAVAIQGVEGAVGPMKVVESVMAAQRSLQTVLAIRDKAVSAYQEIARMAI
ncbi:MAG: flagellar hook-basal body complex protein FliE [Roseiarcus sp.]|jgi:flagellar hook-basal body complex protein FliE